MSVHAPSGTSAFPSALASSDQTGALDAPSARFLRGGRATAPEGVLPATDSREVDITSSSS